MASNYGFWQGAERATGRALQTGMGVMQFQAQQAEAAERLGMEKQRLGMEQERAGREKQAFEYNLKKQKEQDALENTPVPVSMVMPDHKDRPNFTKLAVEAARAAGHEVVEREDGELFASPKTLRFIKEQLQTRTDFQRDSIESTMLDLQLYSDKMGQLIAAGKGKPEEIEGWKKAKQEADVRYGRLILGQKEVASKIAAQKESGPNLSERALIATELGVDPATPEGAAAINKTMNERKIATAKAGKTEVNVTQNISDEVAKQTAKKKAEITTRIESPQFKDDVVKSIKAEKGKDWDILEDAEKKLEIRKEADRQVRDAYGDDVVWDIKDGVLGWYKGDKLIRRWID